MKGLYKFLLLLIIFAVYKPTLSDFNRTSSIYLKNNQTNELRVLYINSLEKKELLELGLMEKLDNKFIGEKNIVGNWDLVRFCVEDKCYDYGKLKVNSYNLNIDFQYNKNEIYDNFNKNNIKLFKVNDLIFFEKVKIFSFKILGYLVGEFLFFLPLNLLIFHCIGYLFYLIFFKKNKISYFKKIYINSLILYFISFIFLYYLGYGFLNRNSALFGFFSYFFLIGIIKIILLLVSKYTINKYKIDENIKTNFEFFIFLFYSILIIIFIIFIIMIHFNFF